MKKEGASPNNGEEKGKEKKERREGEEGEAEKPKKKRNVLKTNKWEQRTTLIGYYPLCM